MKKGNKIPTFNLLIVSLRISTSRALSSASKRTSVNAESLSSSCFLSSTTCGTVSSSSNLKLHE